jgi:hypothetical protein
MILFNRDARRSDRIGSLLDLLDRLGLWRPLRRLRQGANDAAPRQLDLEGVVIVASGVLQQQIRRAGKTGLVSGLSA